MQPDGHYRWEAEDSNGRIFHQFDEHGAERGRNSFKKPAAIRRVSYIPRIDGLPRQDVVLDYAGGERMVKHFGRGFIKPGFGQFEYFNCVVTNRRRIWVTCTGHVRETEPDFEWYI
jgi:hypothetical protein